MSYCKTKRRCCPIFSPCLFSFPSHKLIHFKKHCIRSRYPLQMFFTKPCNCTRSLIFNFLGRSLRIFRMRIFQQNFMVRIQARTLLNYIYIFICTQARTLFYTHPFLWLGTSAKDRWTWEGFHKYCKRSQALHLFTLF